MAVVQRSLQRSATLSKYLIKRFMGDSTMLAIDEEEEIDKIENSPKRYFYCYGVVKHKKLYLYTNHEMLTCLKVIQLPNYTVSLYPNNLSDHEYYMSQHPIVLHLLEDETILATEVDSDPNIFVYAPNSFEKENWFIILKRASNLPLFADDGAMSLFYDEMDPVRQYVDAMKKLLSNTQGENSQETAWLNALVGRMFVSIHGNARVREWVKNRLSRHTVENDDDEPSILGDIAIQDIDVGNSLPVLSNPKLVNIEVDGDMLIEMDIHYDGGVRLVLATEATLSVPAWDAYMKPITVPIVVAVKINRFSARILFKIKPFWESNRIWFGFYRQPELKLELEVEPIISNKLIKLQMVNQVIERRIKDSLEAYVMLPNMDDLSFWDFDDINGSPFENGDFGDLSSDNGTVQATSAVSPIAFFSTIGEEAILSNENSAANISMAGEAKETSFSPLGAKMRKRRSKALLKESLSPSSRSYSHSDSDHDPKDHFGVVESDSSFLSLGHSDKNHSEPKSQSLSDEDTSKNGYVEYLGNAAYSLGQISRQYGLDTKAQVFVKDYATPALKQLEQKTETYRQVVQTQVANVGLTAIEKLGLSPDKVPTSSSSQSDLHTSKPEDIESSKSLRHKSSKTWSVLGLSIKTSAPNSNSLSGATSNENLRKSLRTSRPLTISSSTNLEYDESNEEVSPSSSIAESLNSTELENYSLFLDEKGGVAYRKEQSNRK